jgi:mannosyltransferase OCH1-like enzyme
MRRFASRLLRLFTLALFVTGLYIVVDRVRYERLIKRLYITFDDFTPDYVAALRKLPSAEAERALRAYDYSQYPPADPDWHIPSIIHFIWFKNLYETRPDVTKIPSMGSKAPEICQRYNPDFEIKIWNASAGRDLLEQHYAWFLPTYDNYAHPIQRVDAVKYFVLYHYGGFYLDLDIECRRSLQPIQRFPAWIPRASPQGLNNDAFAARAHHPAWKRMTEMLKPRDINWIFPYLTIFWSTGPQFTTDVLKQWLDENPEHKTYVPGSPKIPTVDHDAVYVLPKEFYSEQYTFFGHTPGGTWHEGDVAVVLWFVARPWVVIVVLLCGIVMPMMICFFIYLRKRRLIAIGRGRYTQLLILDEGEDNEEEEGPEGVEIEGFDHKRLEAG